MEVLEDGPELQAVAGHQPHGALDRLEPAESRELVEQEQHGQALRTGGGAGQGTEALRHHEAQPARVGVEAVRRQHQEQAAGPLLQLGEAEVGMLHDGGHARAIEEVGVALSRGQYAGGLAIRFAEVAVGGAGDEAAGRGTGLHALQEIAKGVGRQGQELAQASEVAPVAGFLGGDEEDEAAEQALASSFQCTSATWPGGSATCASARVAASSATSGEAASTPSSGL